MSSGGAAAILGGVMGFVLAPLLVIAKYSTGWFFSLLMIALGHSLRSGELLPARSL